MSNRTNSMKSIRLTISLIVMTLSGIVYDDRAGEVKPKIPNVLQTYSLT